MENPQANNLITLRNRQTLDIEGVTKLDSFDSKEFMMDTNMGYLCVTGTDLALHESRQRNAFYQRHYR